MHTAFAGLRHRHIFALYDMVKAHPDYTFAGAFEDDADSRKYAASMGMACRYPSYDAILSDPDVEAVALGGCFGDRGPMAIEALRAGKHVIADKPLCTTLDQLDEIEHLAYSTGKKVTAMFTMRYEPKIAALCDLVRSGALGDVNNVYFGGQHPLQYGRRPMWYFDNSKHGGTINDIAIHGIDILSYALGMKNFTIESARCWNRYAAEQPDFCDSAQFMLTADNGAGIIADVSYAVPDGIEFSIPLYWEFNIWGTGGAAEFSLAKELVFYKKSSAVPVILPDKEPDTDFLSDFLNMVCGKETCLAMEDVFSSTRTTLEIQLAADSRT